MIKPIKNRVLILRDDHDEKTAAGIIIPGKKDIPTGTGIIMAIGSEVEEVEVGNKVCFKKLDGHDYKIDGKEHVIMNVESVLGVMQ